MGELKGFCDLHLHSIFSDGTMSPKEIVGFSKATDLAAISITDHDTISGQKEALEAGKALGIEVVTGIEFSIEEGEENLHILGYCFDHENDALVQALEELSKARLERARTILELLSERGMKITLEEVLSEVGAGNIGRPHIARVLHRRGFVTSVGEAFIRWLADGAPCNVPKKVLPLESVVSLLEGAGGIAVWAHPGSNIKKCDLLDRLCDAGVRGVEAWHPNHDERICEAIILAARKRGLLVTGGSDFHFAEMMQADIGEIAVPYRNLIDLRRAASREP